ncbi:hypothetical protein [Mucilaginibacter phyllosphaerae]
MENIVAIAATPIYTEVDNNPVNLIVTEIVKGFNMPDTANLEVTVYKEDGTFIPQCSYLFEAVDGAGQPLTDVAIDDFKKAVDAYCTQVLAVEYFIKSIPRASSLCTQEMQAFNF